MMNVNREQQRWVAYIGISRVMKSAIMSSKLGCRDSESGRNATAKSDHDGTPSTALAWAYKAYRTLITHNLARRQHNF